MLNPIKLDKAEFPYLVREDDTPVESVITISRTRNSFSDEPTLFYLANADLRFLRDRDTPDFIEVRHTWARDDEGDVARIGTFKFTSVEFLNALNGTMTFRAWMTEDPQFYPASVTDPKENPYLEAVRDEEERDKDGYYNNTGFPYTPPPVSIPGFSTPVQVEIQVRNFIPSRGWETWLEEAMGRHAEARAEKEAKRQEYLAQQELARQKREARAARVRTWMKEADEGREYAALRAEMKALPTQEERRAWLKTAAGKRYIELEDIAYEL